MTRNNFKLKVSREDGPVNISGYVDNDRSVIIEEPEIGGGGSSSTEEIIYDDEMWFNYVPSEDPYADNDFILTMNSKAVYVIQIDDVIDFGLSQINIIMNIWNVIGLDNMMTIGTAQYTLNMTEYGTALSPTKTLTSDEKTALAEWCNQAHHVKITKVTYGG